jgi:hypothetical protein
MAARRLICRAVPVGLFKVSVLESGLFIRGAAVDVVAMAHI